MDDGNDAGQAARGGAVGPARGEVPHAEVHLTVGDRYHMTKNSLMETIVDSRRPLTVEQVWRRCAICRKELPRSVRFQGRRFCYRSDCHSRYQAVAYRRLSVCAMCGVELDHHQKMKGAICDRAQCRGTFFHKSIEHPRRCVVCNRPLGSFEPGVTCPTPLCRSLYREEDLQPELQKKAAARRKQQEAAMRAFHARIEALVDGVAPNLGYPDRALLPLVVVPTNERRSIPQAEERRAALRNRLEPLIRDAGALPPEDESQDSAELGTQPDPLQAHLVVGACTTCRGSWRLGGGDHAYLSTQTISRYMTKFPDQSPEEIADSYLACVPQSTYADSCVYHGEMGCGLRREMRSETCLRYHCSGLSGLRKIMAESGSASATFVVSSQGRRVVRSALVEEAGIRRIDELDNPGGSPSANLID